MLSSGSEDPYAATVGEHCGEVVQYTYSNSLFYNSDGHNIMQTAVQNFFIYLNF